MAKDYERINFNIKKDLLIRVDEYCSAGYGRSALLNYLVAVALKDVDVSFFLDVLSGKVVVSHEDQQNAD